MSTDETFMDAALTEARAAAAHADVPVGAVVVHEGAIVGRGHNRREVDHDPTAHAEIIALRAASVTLGRWRLSDCVLYVTLEPCAMCASACVLARIGEVVFGALDEKAGAVQSVAEILDAEWANHTPRWRRGPRREESEAILFEFFEGLRSRREP